MLHAALPWLHYDQTNDKVYCFMCMKASKVGNFRLCASKGDDAFLSCGYTNWKDANGDKRGGLLIRRVHKSTSILLKQQ